jgi:preprotein translocase subunit SecA
MIQEQVEANLDTLLAADFGSESFASFAGNRLSISLDPKLFRKATAEEAIQIAKDEAERLSEATILGAIDENLPAGEDDSEWNWEAIAKFVNVRWDLNVRDRDLKKIGRDRIDEFLIEKARASIQKIDVSDAAPMLDEDYNFRILQKWVKAKFGFDVDIERLRSFHSTSEVKELINEQAVRKYEEKEAEFPVMAGLIQFVQPGSGSRIDREGLIHWAARRFDQPFTVDDIKNKQRDEIREFLVNKSRDQQQLAQQAISNLHSQVAALSDRGGVPLRNGNGAANSLSHWFKETLDYDLPIKEVEKLERNDLEQKLEAIVEDHFHPEMRRMERMVLLEVVDSAWKDHLLAMDYLRSAVGQRGMAQLDPKVEYKREGMRLFEGLWRSIGERVTDLIFRIEQLNEEFVSNTLVETSARHDAAPEASVGEYAEKQAEVADRQQGRSKVETIRNRGEKIGRNEPCPCGSGKKFKACCMRRGE